ncbi:MAG: DUF1080 domain-containing protein [Planctomycetia bacterium]|nr:DUF1080 domain-containing protein [Planctomycetia bacterium]
MRLSKSLIVCFLVLLFVFGTQGVYASDPSGSEPLDLLNEKSLDDFDYFLSDGAAKSDVFSLNQDGILSVKGNPFGWLGTKKEYTNFILNVEYRYPDSANAVNSGLFLRVNGESVMFLPKCVEVQLAPNSMGDLYGFWDMKLGGNTERCKVTENHSLVKTLRAVQRFHNANHEDLTQWHSAEILCCDDIIVVRINGELVNWISGVEIVPGKIAFQSEGAPIEFRNVNLVVLD